MSHEPVMPDGWSFAKSGEPGEEISKRVLRISLARLGQLASELAKREDGPILLSSDQSSTGSALVAIQAGASSTRPPLFLMHPVGGSVMAYYQLARYMRAEQPIFAMENQVTFNPAATVYRDIPEMAARYIEEIRARRRRGPFLLGGYSMGGLVAFEIARQLRAAGEDVRLLALIDTPARVAIAGTDRDDGALTTDDLMMMTTIVAQRADRAVSVSSDDLQRVPPEQRVSYLVERLRAQQVIPPHVDAALFSALLTVVRNNELAQRRYQPEVYDGPIDVFRATEVSPELDHEVGPLFSDPAFGWQEFSSTRVNVTYVPGTHMRVMNQPHVQALGAVLQRRIDEELQRRFAPLY